MDNTGTYNGVKEQRQHINKLSEMLWNGRKGTFAVFRLIENEFIEEMRKYTAMYPNHTAFIEAMRKWYNNSKKYFPTHQLSENEMNQLTYIIESAYIAENLKDLDKAIGQIVLWKKQIDDKYRSVELSNSIEKEIFNRLSSVKQNHPKLWADWCYLVNNDKLQEALEEEEMIEVQNEEQNTDNEPAFDFEGWCNDFWKIRWNTTDERDTETIVNNFREMYKRLKVLEQNYTREKLLSVTEQVLNWITRNELKWPAEAYEKIHQFKQSVLELRAA